MSEQSSGTQIKNGNLDEILALNPAQVLEQVIAGGGPVCEGCTTKSLSKAQTLASFAGIGRISVEQAAERLGEYNAETCGHLGEIVAAEIVLLDLVDV